MLNWQEVASGNNFRKLDVFVCGVRQKWLVLPIPIGLMRLVIQGVSSYPFITPIGRMRQTVREMPALISNLVESVGLGYYLL